MKELNKIRGDKKERTDVMERLFWYNSAPSCWLGWCLLRLQRGVLTVEPAAHSVFLNQPYGPSFLAGKFHYPLLLLLLTNSRAHFGSYEIKGRVYYHQALREAISMFRGAIIQSANIFTKDSSLCFFQFELKYRPRPKPLEGADSMTNSPK